MKHLTPKSVAILTAIFNAAIRLGYFPSAWKISIIIPILKPLKNPSLPSSYRPISLLSVISKIFEKIIPSRFSDFLSTNDCISPNQFGFKANHSPPQQLLRLTEEIMIGFQNSQYTVATFLDITQAFDRVWHSGLKSKFKKINTPTYIINILYSFLENRYFRVRLNSSFSNAYPILAGVPQGSPLSPTLFNIYMADIPPFPDVNTALFADDTVIYTLNSNLQLACNHLQNALNTFIKWTTRWRITLNPSKTQAKIFTLKHIPSLPTLFLGNSQITWLSTSQHVKYLGVYLDTRLTWTPHIKYKIQAANQRLAQLYPLINRSSAMRTNCTLLIYKAILRPLILYACPVWGGTATSNLQKIQIFQNKLLRIAVNARWFIRNTQLHTELGMNP